MNSLFMTASSGSLLSPITTFLGWIINFIYKFFDEVLNFVNVNIGVVVIIFTIITTILLYPLTYKQQKFTNLSKKVNPEINEIRKKYGNKRDQASMMAMQEETKQVYDKYGISTMGSCVNLIIQLPILYSLYNVLRGIPAYIDGVRNIFNPLVDAVVKTPGFLVKMQDVMQNADITGITVNFTKQALATDPTAVKNNIIDVAYKLSSDGWEVFKNSFSNISDVITSTQANLANVNYFGNLNMSETPLTQMTRSFDVISGGGASHSMTTGAAWGILIAALMIPLLSFLTQFVQLKMMNASKGVEVDPTAQQMKTMNKVMPIISLIFVINVPIGLGIYWIAGAVVRAIQSFFLNRKFEKIDMDALIEKNKEKAAKKRKQREERIAATATMSTRRTMSEKARIGTEDQARIDEANEMRQNAAPGTLTARANIVSEFNKRNNKK